VHATLQDERKAVSQISVIILPATWIDNFLNMFLP